MVTTPQGQRVVVAVHGGGIFASPERFEKVYRASVDRSSPDGLTGQYAGKISAQEARDVLEGKLPGAQIVVRLRRDLVGLIPGLRILIYAYCRTFHSMPGPRNIHFRRALTF